MPRVTVRSLAEFAAKPVGDQMRLLAEQKRPDAGASPYKVHYYQSTRSAVFQYFKHGNDQKRVLDAIARVRANKKMADHKRDHNIRAMQAFLKMKPLVARRMVSSKSRTIKAAKSGVEVRFFADLTASENRVEKFFFFNYAQNGFDSGVAARTIELAHWVCGECGMKLRPLQFEFVDLASATVHRRRTSRKTTVSNAIQNLKVIDQLWPII